MQSATAASNRPGRAPRELSRSGALNRGIAGFDLGDSIADFRTRHMGRRRPPDGTWAGMSGFHKF